ncbi:HdeD family acid-resistance protein [Culicoidibacter larvae]|uniref:HdeD family acid-resistance protein n=1 Tax=Culicoidibacter larvae TaxID=2579976 RepID=A0A5R8QB44_9FIRM|nr:DUF308 domain-containing protein [Culicoidibacter larvae]TLG72110.1 hypothetical protein FEZ08_09775 [Culicoidibacter larvae]
MEMEVMGYKHWWLFTLRGILLIILGVVAILNPSEAFMVVLMIVGALLLISGIGISIATIINRKFFPRWGWHLVQGIIDIGFGLILLFVPMESMIVLAYCFGAWTILFALLRFISAFDMRRFGFSAWIWQALLAIVLIIVGILIILNPITSFSLLTILVAIFVIIAGFASIIESVAIKNHQF